MIIRSSFAAPWSAPGDAGLARQGGARAGQPQRQLGRCGAASGGDPARLQSRQALAARDSSGRGPAKHLPAYLGEFVFRLNHRTAGCIRHGFAPSSSMRSKTRPPPTAPWSGRGELFGWNPHRVSRTRRDSFLFQEKDITSYMNFRCIPPNRSLGSILVDLLADCRCLRSSGFANLGAAAIQRWTTLADTL